MLSLFNTPLFPSIDQMQILPNLLNTYKKNNVEIIENNQKRKYDDQQNTPKKIQNIIVQESEIKEFLNRFFEKKHVKIEESNQKLMKILDNCENSKNHLKKTAKMKDFKKNNIYSYNNNIQMKIHTDKIKKLNQMSFFEKKNLISSIDSKNPINMKKEDIFHANDFKKFSCNNFGNSNRNLRDIFCEFQT